MKVLLVALFVCSALGGAAQSLPAVYLNERNEETVPDSASHYRIVDQRPEAGLLPMREYAMNGTLMLRGFLTSQETPVRNGLFTWYHPNGAKASQVHFHDDEVTGLYVAWYDDGKVRERGEYHNGVRTGRWLSVHRNGQKRSEGQYAGNHALGEWRYYYNTGQPAAVESIEQGQPTALTFYNENGTLFDGLLLRRQPPEFPGGETALLDYLNAHTEYPKDARRKGITGKVYVSYTVDEDGRVSQVRVVRGLSADADNEAIRVVKSLPRFKPGREYNVPTAFTYTVPIYFAPDFRLFGGPKPAPTPPVEARATW
ncbi:TonB family protein [Hymenobacter busanensis]|uniref:TonB family protein n=1 Tax=Hymenobacter busanensis TaxID=2607656 RepID=A0A7L5A0U4_9BACT|nr:energy transducer TonB [Hymenobacter busanensis]KAA9338412.1 TonB family protein [Hymenobacter busanensis]QHJ09161.1 TonB family protein [Hymenobacter busanensis]